MRWEKPLMTGSPPKLSADVLRLENDPAGARGTVDRHAHAARLLAVGGPSRAQGDEVLDPPFIARPSCLDALPDPRLLLRELLVQPREIFRFVFERRCLLLEVRRVGAGPREQRAAVELRDARGKTGEKCAVVSNEQQGSLKGRQVFLEPQDRVDVEMVGRLVEQQQIRFRHERFAQQGASPPASGQLSDRAVGGQRQPRDHQLRLLFEAPAIALFELMLQVPQPFERGVMLRAA